jgi:hypothetical protein
MNENRAIFEMSTRQNIPSRAFALRDVGSSVRSKLDVHRIFVLKIDPVVPLISRMPSRQ